MQLLALESGKRLEIPENLNLAELRREFKAEMDSMVKFFGEGARKFLHISSDGSEVWLGTSEQILSEVDHSILENLKAGRSVAVFSLNHVRSLRYHAKNIYQMDLSQEKLSYGYKLTKKDPAKPKNFTIIVDEAENLESSEKPET